MEMPPATQGRRVSAVVDRQLDKLCACLDDALSSRQRSPYAEKRLREEIVGKTDFLRSLLAAAEAECHGGARPEHLAEAEARFAVLEAAFDQWARRTVVAAPEPVEEEVVVGEPEEGDADCSGSSSRSTCSCTESCQQEAAEVDAKREDVVEARDKEGASDVVAEDNDDAEDETAATRREAAAETVAKKREAMGTREEVTLRDATAKKRDTNRKAAAETGRRAGQRRWWRQSAAAWCGGACVVAVVAVGVAVELAAVAHHNVHVYVVPT